MKNLGKIKDLLSREEMKQIQGGAKAAGCLKNGNLCHSQGYRRCCNGTGCSSGGMGTC
jgi:hypothetical protein